MRYSRIILRLEGRFFFFCGFGSDQNLHYYTIPLLSCNFEGYRVRM